MCEEIFAGNKDKVFPVHSMKTNRGRGGTTLLILDLNRVECSTSRPVRFTAGQELLYSFEKGLGAHQNRSGTCHSMSTGVFPGDKAVGT